MDWSHLEKELSFKRFIETVIDVIIERRGRRRRRSKQLLDDLKEKRECCKLMEERQVALFGELALDETLDLW